ncbi:MAG: hypothetical protein E7Z99_07890 [Coriobacteriaceae bacterium]|nr:hypothetical protein [Coriobacteriaceae bacterium]
MGEGRLFFGYETAFWIWRKVGPQAFLALTPSRVRSLADGAPSKERIDAFRREHPDLSTEIIDVIVRYGDQRILPGVKVHVKSGELPDRSFYELEDGVYVASPELCMLQLASKLVPAESVKLAMEMCGSYALDLLYDDPGFCKRPQLTNPKKLEAFAARLYKPGSRARGVQFLRWVAAGSASPRETALCMLLCMPPRFGGYGLALPELNRRIDLSFAEQLAVGAHHYDCDLYWPNARVAVEYDSAQYHTALEKQERDAVRRNMLQHKGVEVVVATRLQVNRSGEFDKLARQVARAVGKRLRIPEKEHVEARKRLRETLFDWDVVAPCWGGEGEGLE